MNPYALLGGVLAVILLVAGSLRIGYVHGGNAVRVELQKQIDAETLKRKAADSSYQQTLGERDAALAAAAALRDAPPPDPKTLIVRIPGNAPNCTCADRSDDYWMRYNAAAAGTAAPAAADVPAPP